MTLKSVPDADGPDLYTCYNCPHFLLTEVGKGQCRQTSPKVFPVFAQPNPALGPGQAPHMQGAVAVFPPAQSDSWCGEHPGRKAYISRQESLGAWEQGGLSQ